jgi:ornithine cyclodeaminase/alanine dehydrogenase-like protein (mu-crystallin family)
MLFFNEEKINQRLPMRDCIQVMRDLFSLNLKEETHNPLRNIMHLSDKNGLMGMMPAYIKPYNVMGIKVLSVFHDNYLKGLSSHQGIVCLFETETGNLLATFDADSITAIRTAAVSGLMTDLLAPKDAETLCIMGSGKQAETHLEAMLTVRNIKKVKVWSPNKERLHAFIEKAPKKHPHSIEAVSTPKEAVENADIICTVTASPTPIVFHEWLKPNVHINAVGASTKDKREIDGDTILDADVYVDSYVSAKNEGGDILLAANENRSVEQIIKADIHDLLLNPSMIDPTKKTVFVSLGIAIEDVAAAWYVLNKAK